MNNKPPMLRFSWRRYISDSARTEVHTLGKRPSQVQYSTVQYSTVDSCTVSKKRKKQKKTVQCITLFPTAHSIFHLSWLNIFFIYWFWPLPSPQHCLLPLGAMNKSRNNVLLCVLCFHAQEKKHNIKKVLKNRPETKKWWFSPNRPLKYIFFSQIFYLLDT